MLASQIIMSRPLEEIHYHLSQLIYLSLAVLKYYFSYICMKQNNQVTNVCSCTCPKIGTLVQLETSHYIMMHTDCSVVSVNSTGNVLGIAGQTL